MASKLNVDNYFFHFVVFVNLKKLSQTKTSFFLDYDDWDMIWVLCKIYYGDNFQRHDNDYCIKWVENTLTAFYSFLMQDFVRD